MKHILVVEDELSISQAVKKFLEHAGFHCTVLNTGEGVIEFVKDNAIDLAILDIMLPIVDGITLCKEIRKFSQLPIIMLTAKHFEQDRILGLQSGADDYVAKPFSAPELVLRVQAILKRTAHLNLNTQTKDKLLVDSTRLVAEFNGETVELTKTESALLEMLTAQPNRVYSREQIIDNVYENYHVISDRTVDSHISKLKRKLAQIAPEKDLVQSVYGAGYRYSPPK